MHITQLRTHATAALGKTKNIQAPAKKETSAAPAKDSPAPIGERVELSSPQAAVTESAPEKVATPSVSAKKPTAHTSDMRQMLEDLASPSGSPKVSVNDKGLLVMGVDDMGIKNDAPVKSSWLSGAAVKDLVHNNAGLGFWSSLKAIAGTFAWAMTGGTFPILFSDSPQHSNDLGVAAKAILAGPAALASPASTPQPPQNYNPAMTGLMMSSFSSQYPNDAASRLIYGAQALKSGTSFF